jgi:hypothetical protein
MAKLSKNGRPIGRPPGAINKKTEQMKKLLEQQGGMDPLQFLWWVLNNRRLPLDLRIKAASDLAPFVAPKLSAVAFKAEVENRHVIEQQTRAIMANPELADAAERLALAMLPPNVIDIRHRIPGPTSAEELER